MRPLSEGTWTDIKALHRRIGVPWRDDFEPGSGKPKYVARVLDDLADSALVDVAQRAIEHIGAQNLIEVADAMSWLRAGGVARVTEMTRIALARALDGCRLHAAMPPDAVLARFARIVDASLQFDYEGVDIVRRERDTLSLFTTGRATANISRCDHLALLDAYAFRGWPDARLFEFLEFVVHPTTRQGDEQAALVDAFNRLLAVDRFELHVAEYQSAHPVYRARSAAAHVTGRPKNLVFASNGLKPEIGLSDAVNNDAVILKNAESCLFYGCSSHPARRAGRGGRGGVNGMTFAST